MKVAIRVDAGGLHGLGHASRMHSLARALAARGATVTWWTTTPVLRRVLQETPALTEDVRALEAHDWDLQVIGRHGADVLVLDHKGAYPTRLLQAVRQRLRVVRVDHPYADPESCDLLIIPNVHQDPDDVARLSDDFEDRLLYGGPYILLAPEAAAWCPASWSPPAPLYCVAGGTDPDRALEYFMGLVGGQPGIYGLGAYRTTPLMVRELPPGSLVLRHDPTVMARADLVLTTFGVTVYEALYLGIPALTVATTEENAQGSRQLMETVQATVDLGRLTTLQREDVRAVIQQLLADAPLRRRMGALGRQLVDAKGASRCAEAILALPG